MHNASLNDALAARLAHLALAGIATEYPNKPGDVLADREARRSPREMHPVFFGCYDWHSAVHSHWTLVRLLRLGRPAGLDAPIRAALRPRFTTSNMEREAAFFQEPEHRSFERMYGWAWLLRLASELRHVGDAEGAAWSASLRPLESVIRSLVLDYLPRLQWPVRSGIHSNSAFALAQSLDYARSAGDVALERCIVDWSFARYAGDRAAPVAFEPSGEDFLSPILTEVDLMRRVLPESDFRAWLDRFLPSLGAGDLGPLGVPVSVSDASDGRIVHLAGLNLSRAWAMRSINSVLDEHDPRQRTLERAAAQHLDAGMASVFSGCYEGEHWLGTFAVYALTDAGVRPRD